MVSPNISAMTEGLGSGSPRRRASSGSSRKHADTRGSLSRWEALAAPRWGQGCRYSAHENLVLDDDGELADGMTSQDAVLDEFGKPSRLQARLETIPDDISGSDPGVGVGAGDAEGVVVVPQQPGALVVGVVILGLVCCAPWIEDLVVQEAQPVRAVRRPPVEGPAVADPGDETAVDVDRCPVLGLVGAGNRRIHRDDTLQRGSRRGSVGGKFVVKGDWYRNTPFRDNDAAEMLWRLDASAGLGFTGLNPQSVVFGPKPGWRTSLNCSILIL